MVTNETKQQIVNLAVNYFLTTGDKITYELLDKLFTGVEQIDELNTAAMLIVGATIVRHIPLRDKTTGLMVLRPYEECYNGEITFWKSNCQEKFIVLLTHNKTLVDLVSGTILPVLEFLNDNHIYLESGTGKGAPDLIDPKTGTTYEVKSNYIKNNSVSSLHDANILLDCAGTHLVGYHVFHNIADTREALFRFPREIPEFNATHAISSELLNLVKSGELIKLIDTELEKAKFQWKP